MKLAVLSFFWCAIASADLTLRQSSKFTIANNVTRGQFTTSFKGTKFLNKTDRGAAGPESLMLANDDGGFACVVANKTCVQKKDFSILSSVMGQGDSKDFKTLSLEFTSLGTTDKVAGLDCQNYKVRRVTAIGTSFAQTQSETLEHSCYSTKLLTLFPTELREAAAKHYHLSGATSQAQAALKKEMSLGLPVRRAVDMDTLTQVSGQKVNQKDRLEIEIVSFDSKPISDSVFEIPKGFKVIEGPDSFGALSKKSPIPSAGLAKLPPEALEQLKKLTPEQRKLLPPDILNMLKSQNR